MDIIIPLTETEVGLLKMTFRKMDPNRLAMRFYTSLFARYPHLRELFPSELTELSNKIVSVFELVVFSFVRQANGFFLLQKEVLQPLRSLGILHAERGVADTHYPLVNEMLLESIRLESPGISDDAVRAWKLALNHLTVAMISNNASMTEPDHQTMRESYQHIRSLLFRID